MSTTKQVVHEVLNSLPDDCTLDEFSYRMYLRRKLERSAKDIEEGRVYSQEQAEEIVNSWFTSSGPTKP
jgi:hypothetical protein